LIGCGDLEMSEQNDRSVPRRVGKPLLETHPHLKDFLPFLDVLNSESPRGAVLVAASHLEILLHQIISSFLAEGSAAEKLLEGFNAPLGSFSAKIAAADALGLLHAAEHRDAEIIRKIRNQFAHEVHMTFEDQKVSSLCKQLIYSAKPYGDVAVDARGLFTSAAVLLTLNLTNRAHYVSKHRLKREDWKI
jgi:mannitol operon repressor